jgi:hypothetical protein
VRRRVVDVPVGKRKAGDTDRSTAPLVPLAQDETHHVPSWCEDGDVRRAGLARVVGDPEREALPDDVGVARTSRTVEGRS